MKIYPTLILLFLFSCWDNGGSDNQNDDLPPTEPEDKLVEVEELGPSLLWDKSTFLMLAEDSVEEKKDLLKLFESQASAWDKSLDHGYIPHLHLSKSSSVIYKDGSGGRLKGIEKLKSVWDKLYERCPSFDNYKFKAPLVINWHDRDSFHPAFYENITKGTYSPPAVKMRFLADGQFFLSAKFNSHHYINIWGEKKKYWHYPNQTHNEIFGYDAKDTPVGADSGFSLDNTFAHEIGHHLFTAWTMNSGKVEFFSLHFSEGMAELFKDICYGEIKESPYWLDQFPTKEKLIESTESYARVPDGEIYFSDGVRNLISFEKKWGNLDTDKLFNAVIDTWESMRGRRIKCIPDYLEFPSRCTWETREPLWLHPNPEKHSPLAFTRGEFAELFCDHYDCPEEFKPIFQMVSENLRDAEY